MANNFTEPSPPDLSTSRGLTLQQPADTDITDSNVKQLSPTTQGHLELLVQHLHKQKAKIGLDKKGRPVIEYEDKKPLPWDPSKANTVTTPSPGQHKDKMSACLELIEYLKKNKYPSGVNLDSSKIGLSKANRYEDGSEFEKTREVLGRGNSAGDIIVIKDKKSGTEHAQKTVMISVFRREEIEAWVDLNESGIAPSLYCFRLNENKVHIHMEKLENVVTLRDVIDKHMNTIRMTDPALVRPFSLCIFQGLLTAVQTMHDKGWTHQDLHAENIMLQENPDSTIRVRVIDFGSSLRIDDKGGPEGFRMDIKEIVRKFSALYIGQEFESARDLDKRDVWTESLSEAADLFGISRAERVELFSLIDSLLRIVGPSETQNIQNVLKRKINEKELDKKMKEVIPLIFRPFEYHSVHQGRGESTVDSFKPMVYDDAVDNNVSVPDGGSSLRITEKTESEVPDDVLEAFRNEMSIGI